MSTPPSTHPFRLPISGAAGRRVLRTALARLGRLARTGVPGCRILTYHRVNDDHPGDRLSVRRDDFRAQLRWLRDSGRPVIGLDQAVQAIASAREAVPDSVVLTFDDGYADNHQHAFPILGEFGFPATFYLATAFVGTGAVLPRYRQCCSQDQGMSWNEASALAAAGHTIGSHTRSHPELGGMAAEAARSEIEAGRDDIQSALGVAPRHFCYPRGSHSALVRNLVQDAGFASATTVRPGPNTPGVDPFLLTRTEISGHDTLAEFAAKLNGDYDGWHGLLQDLRGSGRGIRALGA